MNENIEIQKLEEIKYYLREKERIILNSQIKRNKKEKELKMLQIKRNNIIKNKKNILSKIVSLIIYDAIMLLIIMLLVYSITNRVISNTLITILTYIIVTTISITGAYLSSIVETKIKKIYNKKKLIIISNKIVEKEKEIKFEIDKQEIIKKEITEVMNNLNSVTLETHEINSNYTNGIEYKNNKKDCKIKTKSKYDKKH